jgi:hypothetical protein
MDKGRGRAQISGFFKLPEGLSGPGSPAAAGRPLHFYSDLVEWCRRSTPE